MRRASGGSCSRRHGIAVPALPALERVKALGDPVKRSRPLRCSEAELRARLRAAPALGRTSRRSAGRDVYDTSPRGMLWLRAPRRCAPLMQWGFGTRGCAAVPSCTHSGASRGRIAGGSDPELRQRRLGLPGGSARLATLWGWPTPTRWGEPSPRQPLLVTDPPTARPRASSSSTSTRRSTAATSASRSAIRRADPATSGRAPLISSTSWCSSPHLVLRHGRPRSSMYGLAHVEHSIHRGDAWPPPRSGPSSKTPPVDRVHALTDANDRQRRRASSRQPFEHNSERCSPSSARLYERCSRRRILGTLRGRPPDVR
jgi:hypothetical protein